MSAYLKLNGCFCSAILGLTYNDKQLTNEK